MSKVVHLSDDAHARAKRHCQHAGLKMSEWVAVLIERATEVRHNSETLAPPPAEAATPPRARAAPRVAAPGPVPLAVEPERDAEVPLFAAPPFWARRCAPGAPALGEPSGSV